jgi:predicted regulator of Ras-like GTPase activity (Roadblock/LC7/MglB family)
MAGLTYSKTELAKRLGLTKGRISQLVGDGLPVEPDGRVDALAAAQWVLDNLCSVKAEPTRQAARQMMIQGHTWNVLAYSAGEIPVAVTLAGAEMGLTREQAERLGDLVMMFWATGPNELLEENGMPELLLPHPEAWQGQINWAGLFGADGMSLVSGEIERASREELAAELATVEAADTA